MLSPAINDPIALTMACFPSARLLSRLDWRLPDREVRPRRPTTPHEGWPPAVTAAAGLGKEAAKKAKGGQSSSPHFYGDGEGGYQPRWRQSNGSLVLAKPRGLRRWVEQHLGEFHVSSSFNRASKRVSE